MKPHKVTYDMVNSCPPLWLSMGYPTLTLQRNECVRGRCRSLRARAATGRRWPGSLACHNTRARGQRRPAAHSDGPAASSFLPLGPRTVAAPLPPRMGVSSARALGSLLLLLGSSSIILLARGGTAGLSVGCGEDLAPARRLCRHRPGRPTVYVHHEAPLAQFLRSAAGPRPPAVRAR